MNTKINVIPTPKKIDDTAGKDFFRLEKLSLLVNYTSDEYRAACETLIDYAKKAFDADIRFEDAPNAITFMKREGLAEGAYKIISDDLSVKIHASDSIGALNAVSTLIQIIENVDGTLYVPVVTIEDAPDGCFRSLLVDLARDWHDFKYLKKYVDICRLFKANVLHLHFTDDQSYTLPSKIFPLLSTENRFYSFEQINELIEYAKLRGVEIMPEIDVPGHCISFQQNYPELFGTDGILLQTEESMKAMKALFAELCEIFKYSKYIHIGGDEAEIKKWLDKPESADYYRSVGIDPDMEDKDLLVQRIYANFVNEMANAVFECGKQPIAWEGFGKCVNDFVRKDLLVMSWENYYQVTGDLLDAGFTIINCTWKPNYIVTGHAHWTQKEIFDCNVFTWMPIHWGSPYYNSSLVIEPNDKVIGGGLLAWGDKIEALYPNVEDGVIDEMNLVIERIGATTENEWNFEKRTTYEKFTEAYARLDAILRKII